MKSAAHNTSLRAKRSNLTGQIALSSFGLLAMTAAICFSAIPPAFCASRAEAVQASAKVLKNKVKVGDEIRLLVQVDYPRKYSVEPPSDKINVSPFEIKHVDASVMHKGTNRVQDTFGLTLTVFELGDLKIPPILLHYKDEQGRPGDVLTDPVAVKVVSVGKKLTDKDDIRSIKGPVSTGLQRFWTWVMGIIAALLSIFLIFRLVQRWIRRRREAEALKPPHIRLKIELERLKNLGLLEEHKIKEYYSGLSNVLRNYMERGMQLEALEKTTAEITEEMKEKKFDGALIKMIKDVLESADLVKFAKFAPERSLADRLESEILQIAEETKPVKEVKK